MFRPTRNRPAAQPRDARRAGFTLIEVIVALAILALALSVLLRVISDGLGVTGRADRMAQAGLYAQSLLARIGTDLPLRVGQTEGTSADGADWRVSVAMFGDAGDRQQWPVGAYRVAAEVFWSDGPRRRSIILTTLRLGPKAAAP